MKVLIPIIATLLVVQFTLSFWGGVGTLVGCAIGVGIITLYYRHQRGSE
jgi:flagellin-like protein